MPVIKNPLLLLIVVFFSFSCADDDSEVAPEGKSSKAIGNYVYSIIQGAEQNGAPGQILTEEIKFITTDLSGRSIRRNLTFIASEEGAVIYQNYTGSDTISIRWQLGCTEPIQTLKVMDNVCGLAKDGCVDVEIFELKAKANQDITGWYRICQNFVYGSSAMLISDGNLLGVISSDHIYMTDDPTGDNWKTSFLSQNYDIRNTRFAENGAFYYKTRYSSIYTVMEDLGGSWKTVNTPGIRNSNQMVITKSGDYIYAEEYNSNVYLSSDKGSSWHVMADVNEVTGIPFSSVGSIATENDKIYIITTKNKLITIENQDTAIVDFSNAWSPYRDISDLQMEAVEGFVFVNDYNDGKVYAISTSSGSMVNTSTNYYSTMTKSGGKIYISSNTTNRYSTFNGDSFETHVIEFPDNTLNYYNIRSLTFFKNSPAFMDSNGQVFIYVN